MYLLDDSASSRGASSVVDGVTAGPLLVTSASDLTRASDCEFGFARDLDAVFGRIDAMPQRVDAMLDRTARLGTEHERHLIDDYAQRLTVVEIERPAKGDGLGPHLEREQQSLDAMRGDADVVVQGTFLDPEHSPAPEAGGLRIGFVGYADFLVRMPDGTWRVQDSKLARRAKVTALLQLAAYAEQLERLGLAVDPTVELILGDRSIDAHRLDDIAPVLRVRRARLHRLMRERWAATEPLAWREPSVTYCGTCAWCEHEITLHDDVWQVARLSNTQWTRLSEVGITTLGQLADRAEPVDGIGSSTLQGLVQQARLQREAGSTHSADEHGGASVPPPLEWLDPAALGALPAPSPGDLYFDFEGDPLHTETHPHQWGLDYLFGFVDAQSAFTAYWAHSFAEERDALIAFLDDVEQRRAEHPDLHIYHYAAYERTHLRSLAARHGVGEDTIDEWLRAGVLVDLYPIVTGSMRVGSSSYSIKYLEPLYYPDARKGAAVARGDDSVEQYVEAMRLRADGEEQGAQRILTDIADYNEIDCISTLKLAAWLRERAEIAGVQPASDDDAEPPREIEPSPLREALLALAANPDGTPAEEPDRTPEQRAYAYAAAAIDYHRREHKSFWWEHLHRLGAPLADWSDTRDVFTVDPDARHDQTPWSKTGRQRSLRRQVHLVGTWAPGSRPAVGGRSGPFAVYDHPSPVAVSSRDPLSRYARSITIDALHDDGVTITETLADGADEYRTVPIALTPAPPPDPGQQKPAIEEWGGTLLAAMEEGGDIAELPRDAVLDLLRRVPPRIQGEPEGAIFDCRWPGSVAQPGEGHHVIEAVIAHLRDLDHSYLAVQGPPGTGKTYLGSRVIARLVAEHGWRIGVVAQGHATVEHVLAEVVAAGLPAAQVGKAARTGAAPNQYADAPWTVLAKSDQLATFTAGQSGGYVIGGTSWDLAHPLRVGRGSLDLLVIDEAGQFSLAATIAASMSAHNLLLLGDPQQLPQVSQGTHPEPIDGSALGYLSDGHDVLPDDFGYFLAETRRLHPALAEPVSRLSYDGQLHAHPSAAARLLAGVEPGVHAAAVHHHGNATESVEEADEVVQIIQNLLGTAWNPGPTPSGDPRPDRALRDDDVIVVTPYNAQQQVIRDQLDAHGLRGTRVGTVDKFQGQEAVIAVVSLAASSSRDAPRGMEFLLNRNRLNVAISRAQWAAYLVHSPGLLDSLPHSPVGVAELSAFIRLIEGAHPR